MEKWNRNAFVQAYLHTAEWASNTDEGDPLDSLNLAWSEGARADAERECDEFLLKAAPLIEAAIETGEVRYGPDFDEWGQAGYDFWLTRCRHGCGYWDGDWPEPYGDQLTALAHGAGERHLFAWNGKIEHERG